jgi:glycosyltransferase involved in cell wall biosynthesis
VIDLTPSWNHQLYSNRPLEALETDLSRAEQVEGFLPSSRWLWMQLVLPRVIEREQPDLFHFTNALAPLSTTRPFVLTIHDASLFLYPRYHPWKRLAAMRTVLPVVARHAAAVITPTEVARRDVIRALDLPPGRVHVVHEAPPDTFHRVTDTATLRAVAERYRLPDTFILFVGTMEPRKNLERLVQALAVAHRHGRRLPLVLAGPLGWHMGDGDGNGHGGSHFSALVHDLGLQEWVRHLGYVPTEDLPALYSLATIFAFPSLYEGFGLPVVEAMICGAPVLTSRDSAMAEIAGDAAALADPGSVDELADVLIRLAASADYRESLSAAGLERSRRYSWSQAAAETLSIYSHVLQEAQA